MDTHITAQGDMWDLVAHMRLGSALHMGRLMACNRKLLGYYVFPAGIELVLPEIAPEPPSAMPPWKVARR